MKLKIKLLDPNAKMPVRASERASCLDVFAVEGGLIEPGEVKVVGLGIAAKVEYGWLLKLLIKLGLRDDYEIQVRPRSGLASKKRITVLNTPGTVDGDYRGQIAAILINHGKSIFEYKAGERIAQIGVYPVSLCEAESADELDITARGAGGFGSTGTSEIPSKRT